MMNLGQKSKRNKFLTLESRNIRIIYLLLTKTLQLIISFGNVKNMRDWGGFNKIVIDSVFE